MIDIYRNMGIEYSSELGWHFVPIYYEGQDIVSCSTASGGEAIDITLPMAEEERPLAILSGFDSDGNEVKSRWLKLFKKFIGTK